MTQRDIWTEINSRPPRIKRPFGAALTPKQDGTIPPPFYITEPTHLPRKGVKPIPVEHLRKIMKDEQE